MQDHTTDHNTIFQFLKIHVNICNMFNTYAFIVINYVIMEIHKFNLPTIMKLGATTDLFQ